MMVCLRADFERNELVRRCSWLGLAARDEIWSWSSDGVLDHVCNEQREYHADEPAEYCDVRFVRAGADDEGPEDEGAEGDRAGVDEEPC